MLEDRLRTEAEQYRVISEHSPQFIWLARPDGYVEYCNHWFQTYSGVLPSQTEGCGCAAVIHCEDIEKSRERWANGRVQGEPYEAMARFRNLNGSYNWHHIKMRPIKDENGNVSSWLGCAFDVHQNHLAEIEYERVLQLLGNHKSPDHNRG